jgi:hypothetical protein
MNNEITQTKEGFIKSMLLFILLLGLCFAPFFAFSAEREAMINDANEVKEVPAASICLAPNKSTIDAQVTEAAILVNGKPSGF